MKTTKSPQDRHLRAERRLHLAERTRARAEMKSSNEISFYPEEEVSKIIEERALKARAEKTSAPPSGTLEKGGWFLLQVLKLANNPWTVLAIGLLVVAWVAWLKLAR